MASSSNPTPAESVGRGGAAEPPRFDSPESLQRSRERYQRPPREATRLLAEMSEHKSFWFALRKHGNQDRALGWLRTLHEHSNWPANKKDPSEVLRKEYLRLLDGVKVFNPHYKDQRTLSE